MSESVILVDSPEAEGSLVVKQLDQTVWQTWIAKNRAQELRNSAAFLRGVKCVTIAALLVAAGFWSHLGPFDLAVRFIVAAGAVIAMLHAFHARHFTLATVFGALALLYNPVAPVLSFSGDWPLAIVVASALPFIVSFRSAQAGDATA